MFYCWTPDGILTSYRILPKQKDQKVIIDRLRDIFPEQFNDEEQDLGGTRIYNTSECCIDKITSKIRSFEMKESDRTFTFQFEYMGIPVCSGNRGHGGIYNFLLPPGWRFKKLKVIDPYDKKNVVLELKKQFRYKILRDTSCDTSMIEMPMSSGWGSFSFIIFGQAILSSSFSDEPLEIDIEESEYAINQLPEVSILDKNGRSRLSQELSSKADWLELKPNFFGIGINLNKIIHDLVDKFKSKVK